jgi:hypothetical protein
MYQEVPQRRWCICTSKYLEAGDVSVTEVLAQVLHLLQLQQMDPQNLKDPT